MTGSSRKKKILKIKLSLSQGASSCQFRLCVLIDVKLFVSHRVPYTYLSLRAPQEQFGKCLIISAIKPGGYWEWLRKQPHGNGILKGVEDKYLMRKNSWDKDWETRNGECNRKVRPSNRSGGWTWALERDEGGVGGLGFPSVSWCSPGTSSLLVSSSRSMKSHYLWYWSMGNHWIDTCILKLKTHLKLLLTCLISVSSLCRSVWLLF